jgi:demethylmenaquinone methyltransferase/2-methoxy-6-polyprenyl-1,4-benzoquinol methylase
MPDPDAVNSMFGRIASRYDLANRILSVGCDRGWRRRLVDAVRRGKPGSVLDLATGSGDTAFALGRALPGSVRIVGMDFCEPMLAEARRKAAARGSGARFLAGDALALPLPDASFDAVTISFGLRNLADRARGLAEMRRVLRPGGRLFVLEFSQPSAWFRPLYYFYLRSVIPVLAGWITGDRPAYDYLNDSIGKFPDRAGLRAEIEGAGFASVSSMPLTFGIVALHEAVNPPLS